MLILVIGLILFLGIHSVPIRQSYRSSIINSIGMGAYKGLFALTAAVGLGLTIYGYGLTQADPILFYTEYRPLRHVMMVLMLPVFVFLIAAYVPGHIKATIKHPMLIATKTWAFAHLLVNGKLADILLFGGFLAWGVMALISIKKRERAQPPKEAAKPSVRYDIIAVVFGLTIYVLFAFWGHEIVTGVNLI